MVHARKVIEGFQIRVTNSGNQIIINTSVMLRVDENNVKTVGQLLLSVKERVMPGLFYSFFDKYSN